MFLCVSPNPAIDKRLEVRSLLLGQVNRAHEVKAFAGGKAAHVAMVLRALGERPQWIGQCGGASGEELVAGLCALGIETTAIRTQQRTRTNLEILESDGKVTEILEPGARLGAGEWAAFEERCKELFAQGAAQLSVIFSGSLPQGTGLDLYARLITAAREFKCRTLLDTSGEALRLGLGAMPHFVKPNREEATRLLEVPVNSLSTGAAAVRRLLELGAQSAALSMGVDGLLFCGGLNAPVLHAAALPVKARSTVGCGDSAFAGFALGMASNLPPEERLRLAAACATANCLADSPGGARIEDIRNFQRQVSVQAVVPAA